MAIPSKKIAIVGGGPGSFVSAVLLTQLTADYEVTVWERNQADDTFGFGVVFSDETLTAFEAADPQTYARISESFAKWSEIDVYSQAHRPMLWRAWFSPHWDGCICSRSCRSAPGRSA